MVTTSRVKKSARHHAQYRGDRCRASRLLVASWKECHVLVRWCDYLDLHHLDTHWIGVQGEERDEIAQPKFGKSSPVPNLDAISSFMRTVRRSNCFHKGIIIQNGLASLCSHHHDRHLGYLS